MIPSQDGAAVVWCEGAFNTTNGKTAHGLVRYTRRYTVRAVIDSKHAGKDAGAVLDGRDAGIPVVATLDEAVQIGDPRTLVVGIAPDGGRLTQRDRDAVRAALSMGINVDCGLHDFLSDDPELAQIARSTGARIRDVRKPPPIRDLHGFSGRIDQVKSRRIAVLGTDSAVGKRTTAVLLVEEMRKRGKDAEMIGTGQTAWMQGWPYSLVLDSLINDFIAGELEHQVLRVWDDRKPDVIVVEGQGSLMNPAYPGGHEILAATRPHGIIMQHAPARKEYDGFPGYPLHPLELQIQATELISGKKVLGVALNHERLTAEELASERARIRETLGIPCQAPLKEGVGDLVDAILKER